MSGRVVVTGMGCISGLGVGLAETWSKIVGGEGAIGPTGLAVPAARVDAGRCAAALATLDLRRMGQLDPLSAFALVATLEAVGQAGLAGHSSLARRTAVVLGCGSGGNATIDTAFERFYAQGRSKVHPQTIPSSMLSAPASHVAMLLGLHGPAMVISSACASSAHALGEAMHMVRSGRVDVAIAGGSEACLSPGSLIAWASLGVMAPDTCRPFSRDRKGLVLGEGAAVMVIESEDHALARGAVILGELAGYGTSCDAMDITAPDQAGIELAIRDAHEDAGLPTEAPALISAHGTGTRLNDKVEAAALTAIYGDDCAGKTIIATKSAHGHLIGATAALEFVIGMRALAAGLAPPVLGFSEPDPACALPLALGPTAFACDALVSNSFAFGGLNAVLIGRKAT